MGAAAQGMQWDTHCKRSDLYAVFWISLAVPLLRLLLQKTILEPSASYLLLSPAYKKTGLVPDKLKLKIAKFTESQWKFLVYGSFLALTLHAVWGEPWFTDTTYYWRGWPTQTFSLALKLLYGCELGYYLSGVFMLMLWETRRKDHKIMLLHHLVTIALIAASYYSNFLRVGSMVLLVHDVNDVFMEAAKMCKYMDLELPSTAIFVAFMLSWVASRLVYLPFWIIHSTIFETLERDWPPPRWWVYPTYNATLVGLLLLHTYWFALICKIALHILSTGAGHDIREDGISSSNTTNGHSEEDPSKLTHLQG